MELRSLATASPSFVGSCQIVYIGEKAASKWDKFNSIINDEHPSYRALKETLE